MLYSLQSSIMPTSYIYSRPRRSVKDVGCSRIQVRILQVTLVIVSQNSIESSRIVLQLLTEIISQQTFLRRMLNRIPDVTDLGIKLTVEPLSISTSYSKVTATLPRNSSIVASVQKLRTNSVTLSGFARQCAFQTLTASVLLLLFKNTRPSILSRSCGGIAQRPSRGIYKLLAIQRRAARQSFINLSLIHI